MNWPPIALELYNWAVAATGLPVIWGRQNAGRPNAPYVEISIGNIERLGTDWRDVKTNPLVIPSTAVTADPATDRLAKAAHGWSTGDGPIQLTTTGTLPGGLAIATNYWIVVVDADHVKLASSFLNAMNASPVTIDITDAGTGVHSLVSVATTLRVGQEVTRTARGPRMLAIGFRCFAAAGPFVPGSGPGAMLDAIMTLAPLRKETLKAAGLGLANFSPIISTEGKINASVLEPQALMTANFHTASEVSDVAGFIEFVNAQATISSANLTIATDSGQ